MKTMVISVVVMMFTISCFDSRTSPEVRALRRAVRYGARAKLTLKVIDSDGNAISNATCHVGFSNMERTLHSADGKSNEEGLFTAEGRAKWHIGGNVKKEGYYKTQFEFLRSARMERLKDGCWTPWNPIISVELQKIRNPVPMYVGFAGLTKKGNIANPFPMDKEIGFDCEKNDYVHPYGSGEVTDFTVRVSSLDIPEEAAIQMNEFTNLVNSVTNRGDLAQIHLKYRGILSTYHEFVMRVPDPDGGFIRKKKLLKKTLESEYEAPQTGYTNELRIIREGNTKFSELSSTDVSPDDYVIFRSRVIRDAKGNILSSNVGKIYGPIRHGINRRKLLGSMNFMYYFNPCPNNNSIEFDSQNNLFFPQYKTSYAP